MTTSRFHASGPLSGPPLFLRRLRRLLSWTCPRWNSWQMMMGAMRATMMPSPWTEPTWWTYTPSDDNLNLSEVSQTTVTKSNGFAGGTLTGVVMDADTEQGIANAEVVLSDYYNLSATANEKRRLHLCFAPSGRLHCRGFRAQSPKPDENSRTRRRRNEDSQFRPRAGLGQWPRAGNGLCGREGPAGRRAYSSRAGRYAGGRSPPGASGASPREKTTARQIMRG